MRCSSRLGVALCLWLSLADAQTAILQIQVLEGDGLVHLAGSVSARPILVQVTDEVGRPVEDAVVSIRLPDEDPTGVFRSGLKTEVATTGPDGKAVIAGIQWGPVAGPVRIRIAAARDQTRAGAIIGQYLLEPSAHLAEQVLTSDSGRIARKASRGKWLMAAAAALGGGLAIGWTARQNSKSPSAGAAASPAIAIQIGPPTISVGRP